MDTLGVSLRYWLRWTVEPHAPWPLFPAVLQSGDQLGLMIMEGPILNLLTAPFFAFGSTVGVWLARAFVLIVCFGLCALNIRLWNGVYLSGVSAAKALRFLPIIGLGWVFFPKYIPDGIAMLLVLSGSALLVNPRSKWDGLLVFVMVGAGLFMKPTAITTLGLTLLTPWKVPSLTSRLSALILSITIVGSYYLWGTQYLQDMVGGETLFRLSPPPFREALFGFFGSKELWSFLIDGFGLFGGTVLLFAFGRKNFRLTYKIWLLLICQVILIAAIDGEHAYGHRYYFIGCLPSLCLLIQAFFVDSSNTPPFSFQQKLLSLLIVINAINYSVQELRPMFVTLTVDRELDFSLCQNLKKNLPHWPWNQGYAFRTAHRPYPLMGICFAEREGSTTAKHGLYLEGEAFASNCKEIKRSGNVLAVQCDE